MKLGLGFSSLNLEYNSGEAVLLALACDGWSLWLVLNLAVRYLSCNLLLVVSQVAL